MNEQTLVQPTVPHRVRSILAALTLSGIVGIVVATMFGFEEPQMPMLLASVAMVLAAPIAALIHLGGTRTLTNDEKSTWLRAFGSAKVWSALSEYLSSANLSESAHRLELASKHHPAGRDSN